MFRVDAGPADLDEIPAQLGGFRTARGANVTLIADPERLAFTDPAVIDGTIVAPRSRVMLDLTLEARGSSAAQLFFDLWTGQA